MELEFQFEGSWENYFFKIAEVLSYVQSEDRIGLINLREAAFGEIKAEVSERYQYL